MTPFDHSTNLYLHDKLQYEKKKCREKKNTKVLNRFSSDDKNEKLLLLLLLVPELYALGHFFQRLAVVELEFGPPPEEVLQLGDEGDLGFHPDVEASQLFVQLQPYVCRTT